MRTLLICHCDDDINRLAMSRWLASCSDLAGIIVLEETAERKKKRVRREIQRVGWLRFLDVLAFRLYYAFFLAPKDREWEIATLAALKERFPAGKTGTEELRTTSPNTPEAEEFIRRLAPDIMLARCKTLLSERVFRLPTRATLVMHPGICPEYRNAHGCFWALANDDCERVGMTLLQIDKGVDTGSVFGYYSYPYDEIDESHIVIQHRVVLENLDALAAKLHEIAEGRAVRVDTRGHRSAEWGQLWMTRYLRWKRRARARRKDRC